MSGNAFLLKLRVVAQVANALPLMCDVFGHCQSSLALILPCRIVSVHISHMLARAKGGADHLRHVLVKLER